MRTFTDRLHAGDLEGLVALYEPDAVFEVEPGTVVAGRDAIREALAGLVAMRPEMDANTVQVLTADSVALVVNEWEDGALADFRRHLEDWVPHEGVYFAHDDFEIRTQNLHEDERRNGHAHVKAMMMGATSHAIPVAGGEPLFGQWQRLLLLELDEPKDRDVVLHVFGG